MIHLLINNSIFSQSTRSNCIKRAKRVLLLKQLIMKICRLTFAVIYPVPTNFIFSQQFKFHVMLACRICGNIILIVEDRMCDSKVKQ